MRPMPTVVEGRTLSGAPARVRLGPVEGPTALGPPGAAVPVAALRVRHGYRTTVVEAPSGWTLSAVEHLCAALGGLGLHEGVRAEVEGEGPPWLDGAAAAWCQALARLDLRPSRPRLRVARDAVLEVGRSRYVFRVQNTSIVSVRFVTDDVRLAEEARWAGDGDDFRVRVAPARTFFFARDVEEALAASFRVEVPPESAVLLTPERIEVAGVPFSADEPARHKLLDLVGDAFLHGGPPIGELVATRPGHAATHAAMTEARRQGILEVCT